MHKYYRTFAFLSLITVFFCVMCLSGCNKSTNNGFHEESSAESSVKAIEASDDIDTPVEDIPIEENTMPKEEFVIEYEPDLERTSLLEYNGSGGDVVIPDGVTWIESFVFQNNTAVTGIIFPDSLEAISFGVFAGCTSLKSVTIPLSVEFIGEGAFAVDYISSTKGNETPLANLTFYGKAGSYAEEYAKDHRIPFLADNDGSENEETLASAYANSEDSNVTDDSEESGMTHGDNYVGEIPGKVYVFPFGYFPEEGNLVEAPYEMPSWDSIVGGD